MADRLAPGDMVIEKVTPWIRNERLGMVIAVADARACNAYALTSDRNVAYVLFPGGIRGPFLLGQLARAASAA